ncbi:MAG: DNA-binding response OmpR family regulator [Cyclobacteriaceae bacterium]|jgi:DNA-binding response OmpR family regulator
MNILIIEDENDLARSIMTYLSKEGYQCEWASNFKEAIEKVHLYTYDCILVDINLPDGSGMKVIERLKKVKSKSGIIIISARNSIDDKIEGLDIGADDYLTKPFDLSELNARVKSIIRRRNFDGQNEIIFKEITILPDERVVTIHGSPTKLTKKEYDLLLYFMSNQNRVITKESIAEHLWGDDMDMADSFDFIYAHLKNLRKKMLEKSGGDYIQTVYGVGYKFTRF